MSVPELAPVAGRAARLAAAGGAARGEGPNSGAPGTQSPAESIQDAPRGLGAGALLRAPLLPVAQVLAGHLLHGVLGE